MLCSLHGPASSIKMTHFASFTTPDLPPTLAARLAACKGIHSNKDRPVKPSQPTPNIPRRHLASHNPYSKPTASSHTLYTILLPSRGDATAKSNSVSNTELSLILHLSAPAVWQYTLNATQISMNQTTVSILHYSARTPAHRFLKRTTIYLLNNKMAQCSTYITPYLPANFSCPFCPMQRHPSQQISASQILLTNSQHTTSPPS